MNSNSKHLYYFGHSTRTVSKTALTGTARMLMWKDALIPGVFAIAALLTGITFGIGGFMSQDAWYHYEQTIVYHGKQVKCTQATHQVNKLFDNPGHNYNLGAVCVAADGSILPLKDPMASIAHQKPVLATP